MALPLSIESLVNARAVESSRIEYKASWNPDACVRTLCAFANDIDGTDGGYIVIGVEERDGRPVLPPCGIDPGDVDALQKDLLNKCHFIEPFYHPRVEACALKGKTVVVLAASAGSARPYKASRSVFKGQSDKAYYIRRGSSTVEADAAAVRELFDKSSQLPYDDRENPFAEASDLDAELMRRHLRTVGSSLAPLAETMPAEEIAEDMRLLAGPREWRMPRNVAVLMFSRRTSELFPGARIEVVDMPDPTGRGMVEKTFTGPIQDQLADALDYINGYMLAEMVDKPDGEIETRRVWNYPPNAIKEILANAVYHRDYRLQEPITVVKTPSCLEVKSFPGLDRSITDDKIARLDIRSSGAYRNRRIGNFLKELGLTEGRNTGIPTAVAALAANGSAPPLFLTDAERSSLTVRIPVHPRFKERDVAAGRLSAGVGNGKDGRAEAGSSGKTRKNRTREELRRDIVTRLAAGAASAREISRSLGYNGVSKTLRDALLELDETGAIELFGNGRSTAYRLRRRG